LEVRISTSKLIVDIAGQIFEAGGGQRGQLLTGLIPLWMEVISEGQEGDCVGYISPSTRITNLNAAVPVDVSDWPQFGV